MNIQWGNLYDKIFTVGASDSKLAFKQSVLKLCETKNIPADDPYWTSVSCERFIIVLLCDCG